MLPHGGGVPRAGVLYPGTSGHHHSQVWATYSPTNTQRIYICCLEAGSNANTMLKFLVQSELLNNNITNIYSLKLPVVCSMKCPFTVAKSKVKYIVDAIVRQMNNIPTQSFHVKKGLFKDLTFQF